MTRTTHDDILGFLDEVHGDTLSQREATVDGAVTRIEKGAFRAYSALKDLSQNGTPSVVQIEEVEATSAEERKPDPEKQRIPDPVAVVSGVGADFKDPGGTKTFIIRRPKAPSRR